MVVISWISMQVQQSINESTNRCRANTMRVNWIIGCMIELRPCLFHWWSRRANIGRSGSHSLILCNRNRCCWHSLDHIVCASRAGCHSMTAATAPSLSNSCWAGRWISCNLVDHSFRHRNTAAWLLARLDTVTRSESIDNTGVLQSLVVQLWLVNAAYDRVLTAKDR